MTATFQSNMKHYLFVQSYGYA